MIRKALLPLVLLLSCQNFAQENYNSETIIVTHGDISATTFKKDSTANALVIFESGKSYVHRGEYDLRTEKKIKIKILNKSGFDNANITIPLYNNERSREKVKDIFATTYNEIDGEIVRTKLKEENIFEEKYDENHTLIKFTLPNIKEGSVITYGYKIISPFMFKYHGWHFQGDLPKLYSEYNTSIPANWTYHIKLVGGKKLSVNESKIEKKCLEMSYGASADCSESIYAMKDIPAFIEEDYTTTRDNYLARIEYELESFQGMDGVIKHYTKTWKDVDKELRTDKEIGKQLKKTLDLEDYFDASLINEKDELKKAKAIYNFVQTNYKWNGAYNIFNDVSIKDLQKNKSGNVSSINILLHNLLKEANINVKPVLLSTRNNGFPTTIYPVLYDYNYLIAQVTINNKDYLLDATDEYLSFGTIPFRCLNQYGRLIDFKNGSKWIDLKANTISRVFYNVTLDLQENDMTRGSVNSKITGYHALNLKKKYFSNKNGYIEKLDGLNEDLEVTNLTIDCNNKTSPEFKESYTIEYFPEDTGDNIYLNPFFITFFDENPFKLQERSYPIDFGYTDTYYYAVKLNLPEAYTIAEAPKDLKMMLPNNAGQFMLSSKQMGKALVLNLRISFKESIYPPEYYPYLKEFMNNIVDIQNNSLVVLRKK
ncbi:DUF3857 domain-containing protein [Cognatitamlana onchidii]|uniref:DUF3857 domain-containing protein n=1 Tax=Cognatitamlana onchidii TaxID=2562860 RepID=UPI0010A5F831|nr:DUF3857 domain-containing protein [Algibacter onchidii]